MKPKILNDLTNILAKLAGSSDYDPRVKYDTSLEYYGNQIPVLPSPGSGNIGKVVTAKDGGYELKDPAVPTPASIVTATGQMTAQQKSDTLGNIGGEPEKLTVTVTESGGVYSADKTLDEITAAYVNGKVPVVKFVDDVYELSYTDFADFAFSVCIDGKIKQLYLTSTGSGDIWFYTETIVQPAPSTVAVSGTTPTITPAANTIYECGELTALTVTAITNPGDFIIRFTSGATATTTNFPASMKFPEAFAPEANTRYEINVSNGYALAVGWPTT